MHPSDELLAGLTEAQRAAVTHVDGALLVLAGPGSGKTRVITRRTAYLVAHGIPPWQILAVTFTNKAAGEMRGRIDELLPPSVEGTRGLVVSTFHAFCARVLRRHAEAAGVDPSFVIYDTADQRDAIKEAIAEADVNAQSFSVATVAAAISAAKNDLLDAEDLARTAQEWSARSIARAYAAYESILWRAKALDFDDLLMRTARMLVRDADVRRELQERFRYILVDEYQDTNAAQFIVAKAIAEAHGNLCVVGDPDQSIYGWRGADISNILDFERHFPGAAVVRLGENFRSTGNIVAVSSALIAKNRRRKAKELFSSAAAGPPVRVVAGDDEHAEAGSVLRAIRAWTGEGLPLREIAVLYRMNSLSRVIEAVLRDAAVPYAVARGTAFFDRREIRDALAYLRLTWNPADGVSLDRVVNVPPRGLGAKSLAALRAHATRRGVPLLAALEDAGSVAGVSDRAAAAAIGVASMIRRWRDEAARSGGVDAAALAALVRRILDESGLLEHHGTPSRREEEEGVDRLGNLSELVSAASEFTPSDEGSTAVRPLASLFDLLGAWLETVALVSDADAIDPERGAVTLMTLHAAKGLEFDAVAMIGLEEGVLPHARSAERDAELEEERRLCYVGLTRARRHLQLSWARGRTLRGVFQRSIASSFLDELPAESPGVLERLDRAAARRGSLLRQAGSRRGASDDDAVDPIPEDDVWEVDVSEDAAEGHEGDGRGRAAATIVVGCMVRHRIFGLGRVRSILPRGSSSSAVIDFQSVGTKTLILAYAGLERVG
ncbi:MAG TPA: UvrD-helicase domain-containing protein [Phycisphaerales bacterium]|nr:UvrD-helicase domain-containing protein [Phycisphaerales bacterium]HMP36866.1 UvrD-helicase domain-containing protein [Phycisphaerales bacterium]